MHSVFFITLLNQITKCYRQTKVTASGNHVELAVLWYFQGQHVGVICRNLQGLDTPHILSFIATVSLLPLAPRTVSHTHALLRLNMPNLIRKIREKT